MATTTPVKTTPAPTSAAWQARAKNLAIAAAGKAQWLSSNQIAKAQQTTATGSKLLAWWTPSGDKAGLSRSISVFGGAGMLPSWFTSREQYSSFYEKQSEEGKAKLKAAWYWAPDTQKEKETLKPEKSTAEDIAPSASEQTQKEISPAAPAPTETKEEKTTEKQKQLDYQDTSAKRQAEVMANINAYKVSNPEAFANRKEFETFFHYWERSAGQQAWLNTAWKGTEQGKKDVSRLSQLLTMTGDSLSKISDTDVALLQTYNQWQKIAEYQTAKQNKDNKDLVNNTVETTDVSDQKSIMEQILEAFWLANTDTKTLQEEYDALYQERVAGIASQLSAAKETVNSYKTDYDNALTSAKKMFKWTGATDSYIRAYAAKQQEDMLPQYQEANDTYNNLLSNYNMAVDDVKSQVWYMAQQKSIDAQEFSQKLQALGFYYQYTPEGIAAQAAAKYYAENPDMDSSNVATSRMAVNQQLTKYYDKYSAIIQRPQGQVLNDIMNYAKQKWITVSQAFKENFLTPLQDKDAYKAMIAKETSGNVSRWVVGTDDDGYPIYGFVDLTNKRVTIPGQTSKSESTIRDQQIKWIQDAIYTAGWDTAKWIANIADGTDGWYCWYFINNINMAQWGQKIFFNSLADKMKQITPWETAHVWDYVIMDTWAKLKDWTPAGHVGYVLSVNNDWTITIKDSNRKSDGKVLTHNIDINDKRIKWYTVPSKTLTMSGIEDSWPGMSDQTRQNAISLITGSWKFTKDQRNSMKKAIENWEDPAIVILNQAKAIMETKQSTDTANYEAAREQIYAIKDLLLEYYDKWWKTWILEWNYEKVINRLWEVNDPQLVTIATQISSALQVYRNAVSGTAYSVKEWQEIASVFPGINKSEWLNMAIIKWRLWAFDVTIDANYSHVLWQSLYNQVKSYLPKHEDHSSQNLMNQIKIYTNSLNESNEWSIYSWYSTVSIPKEVQNLLDTWSTM